MELMLKIGIRERRSETWRLGEREARNEDGKGQGGTEKEDGAARRVRLRGNEQKSSGRREGWTATINEVTMVQDMI